jgi:hypothetical protein
VKDDSAFVWVGDRIFISSILSFQDFLNSSGGDRNTSPAVGGTLESSTRVQHSVTRVIAKSDLAG